MSQLLKAVLFVGSVREGRNAERAYKFVKKGLEAKGFEVTVVDPKVLPFPVLQTPFHFYPDPTKAPQFLQDTNAQLKQADAVVFVSGEYNRSIPPALSNAIDHFSPGAYGWKGCLIATYSPSTVGGAIAGASLAPMCRELGLQLTPGLVTIGLVNKALDAEGQVQAGFENLQGSLDFAISQLSFLSKALKHAKADAANVPKVQFYS